jgi:hypothetical protein
MSMDPELWLQQCRIYQNKDKETITLTYANDDNFYKDLDRYVFDGYKLKIIFLNDKLANGSLLIGRIIACFNGQILIDDFKQIYNNLHDILEFNSQEHFLEAVMKCSERNNKIYKTYLFKYNATPGEEPILCLEPAGEGLPSSSFTIDI